MSLSDKKNWEDNFDYEDVKQAVQELKNKLNDGFNNQFPTFIEESFKEIFGEELMEEKEWKKK